MNFVCYLCFFKSFTVTKNPYVKIDYHFKLQGEKSNKVFQPFDSREIINKSAKMLKDY